MAVRKKLKKRILNSPIAHVVLSFLMSIILRVIYLLSRIEHRYAPETLPYLRGEKPAIFCFWHGRMIMHPFVKPDSRKMFVLISHHNDGALITATMRWFGVYSVRGSKKLGGTRAVLELMAVTDAGGNISITPDGPRGPFQRAASGAAYVSAKTGYPILPITFSASRHVRFRSWDKFMLPKPFGRILFISGPPLSITDDSDESLRNATIALETSLSSLTAEADHACGVAV